MSLLAYDSTPWAEVGTAKCSSLQAYEIQVYLLLMAAATDAEAEKAEHATWQQQQQQQLLAQTTECCIACKPAYRRISEVQRPSVASASSVTNKYSLLCRNRGCSSSFTSASTAAASMARLLGEYLLQQDQDCAFTLNNVMHAE
jgi:hypothetical protein